MSEGKAYLWSDGNWYTTPEITAHDEVRILRAELDRLREALDAIRYYGRLAYSPDAYRMIEIADAALQEDDDE